MAEMKYWQAINTALVEEMERDEMVCLFGQDVARVGGPFGATRGLMDQFGDRRVWDTPISELGVAGLAVGAAMCGVRPIVELMYMDFLPLALDQLVNQAAKMRFMSGGRYALPFTMRTMVAARTQSGPQHSQSFETWVGQVPGLRVVWPSCPADARGLLKSAVRSDDPVVVMESLSAWRTKGEVPEGDVVVPIGQAAIRRPGRDITVVAVGGAVLTALSAAEQLAEQGVDAEVLDLRSISPLDEESVLASVSSTGALLVVQEGPEPFGVGRTVVAATALRDPSMLRVPPQILASPFSPIPFAPELEADFYPGVDRVVAKASRMVGAAA